MTVAIDYTVLLDLGDTDPDTFDLDPFAPFHGVLGATPARHVELVLTVPATNMLQAITSTLPFVTGTLGFEPYVVRAMSTTAYDAGFDMLDSTQVITVAEAARLMGVTPSAVRQRLASASLAGHRDGRDWRVHARLANLYAATGEPVARIRVPAGQEVVHDGIRYRPTGGAHSVGIDPLAHSYRAVSDDA